MLVQLVTYFTMRIMILLNKPSLVYILMLNLVDMSDQISVSDSFDGFTFKA